MVLAALGTRLALKLTKGQCTSAAFHMSTGAVSIYHTPQYPRNVLGPFNKRVLADGLSPFLPSPTRGSKLFGLMVDMFRKGHFFRSKRPLSLEKNSGGLMKGSICPVNINYSNLFCVISGKSIAPLLVVAMAAEGFHPPIFATGQCLPAKLEMPAPTPGAMSAQCQSSSHKPLYPTWPPPTPPTMRGPSLTPSTSPWTWTGRRGAASPPAPGLHWCRAEGLPGRGGLCWRTSETGESQQTFRTSKISSGLKSLQSLTIVLHD